ncbi:MAG: hypothetical protein AAGE96_09095 [Cyanobacteria bacterium P01_G01_bin.19]
MNIFDDHRPGYEEEAQAAGETLGVEHAPTSGAFPPTKEEALSDQCPECGSYNTILLHAGGAFKCLKCDRTFDDEYWETNEPPLTLGNVPPDFLEEILK